MIKKYILLNADYLKSIFCILQNEKKEYEWITRQTVYQNLIQLCSIQHFQDRHDISSCHRNILILLLYKPISLLDVLTTRFSTMNALSIWDSESFHEREYLLNFFGLILGSKKDQIRTIVSLWKSKNNASLDHLLNSNAIHLCRNSDFHVFQMGLECLNLQKSFPFDSVYEILKSLLDLKEDCHYPQLKCLLDFIQDNFNKNLQQMHSYSRIMKRLLHFKLTLRSRCVKVTRHDVYFEIPFKTRSVLDSTSKILLSFYLTSDHYKSILNLALKSIDTLIEFESKQQQQQDDISAFIGLMESLLFFEKYTIVCLQCHSDSSLVLKTLTKFYLDLLSFVESDGQLDDQKPIRDKLRQHVCNWISKLSLYPCNYKSLIDLLSNCIPKRLVLHNQESEYLRQIGCMIHSIQMHLVQGFSKNRVRVSSSGGSRSFIKSKKDSLESKTDQDVSVIKSFEIAIQEFIKYDLLHTMREAQRLLTRVPSSLALHSQLKELVHEMARHLKSLPNTSNASSLILRNSIDSSSTSTRVYTRKTLPQITSTNHPPTESMTKLSVFPLLN